VAASPEERGVRQDVHATRDAYTAAHMTVNVQSPKPADARGVLPPPLGRLPERVRGRDLLIDRLSDLVETPDGRAHVLTGLGGLGKSTVALRVAEVALEQGRPVWWVPGVDGSSLTSALLELARALGADAGAVQAAQAGRADPSDVLWGRLEAHRGWMLVIDNADDLRALEVAGRPARDGNGWVRGSRAGLVVVTSRDGDMRHWGRSAELHSVGWLSDADGGRLLLDLAPRAGDQPEAEALSAQLGGLALALHHTGSHLGSPFTAEQSFAEYGTALETGFETLLGPPGAADDREVVTRTWEVSLEQLAGAGVPQARELLRVLACFAPAVPIPVEGLDHEVLGRVCGAQGPAGVRAGLEALLSVGLIETSTPGRRPGGAGVIVHPLVAETIRRQFRSEDGGRSAAVAIDVLAAATAELDAEDPDDWSVWFAWLPHLEELLVTASMLVEEPSSAILAYAAIGAARTLLWAGSYAASLAIAEAGLRHTQRLGVEHLGTLGLRKREAGAHAFLGHAAEAERMYRDLLDMEERVLGPDHPHTLTTRYEIAQTVATQGDAAEAERLYRDVLQTRERVLGPDHPNTLTTRYEIARMVAEQGNPTEAERMYRDFLNVEERVLGPDHPNTLGTRYSLARAVAEQGDPTEAERMYRDLLNIEERVLGPDHPNTLSVRHEIARMIARQGNAAEAERLYRGVLQAQERVLGNDHPNTLTTRYEIARLMTRQGNAAEAERLYRGVLQAQERVLGAAHPHTRITARALRALTGAEDEGVDD
jgi:tetratricopeptide (TPR) repeat protein